MYNEPLGSPSLAPSLRQTAGRPNSNSCSQIPQQAQILADHLAAVRSDVMRSTEQMLSLIQERAEAFQKDALSKAESEFTELRTENENLKNELTRIQNKQETGGTGDTAPPGRVSMSCEIVAMTRFRSDEDDLYFGHSHPSRSPMDPQATPPGTLSPSLTSSVPAGRSHPSTLVASIPGTNSEESLRMATTDSTPSRQGMKSVQLPPEMPEDPEPPCDGPPRLKLSRSKSAKRLTKRAKTRAFSTMSKLPSIKKARTGRDRIFPSSTKPRDKDVERKSSEADLNALNEESVDRQNSYQKSALDGPRAQKVFGVSRGIASTPANNHDSHATRRASVVGREAQPVFADLTQMKERVRAAVAKHDYNVADYYWEEGIAQNVARSQYFEWTTLAVIAFNAIWIAIDMDNNDAELLFNAEPVYQVAEHFFCVYFSCEWLVRFLAFRVKRDCIRDAWFCFDSCLVIMMILETWVMNLILAISSTGQSSGLGNTSVFKLVRLVRLTRMARMAKLLHAVPELIILIKGIVVAARTVFFTLLLLAIIIYFFAIVFRQVTEDTDIGDKYFPSVTASMGTLLLDGVIPDQSNLVRESDSSHFLLGALVVMFILLATLTVMNMLVGVLCEVVSVVSAVEKEQLTVNYVKTKLLKMFDDPKVDTDGSCSISRKEFENLLVNEEAASIIQDMGVDVVGLVDFADIIFEDDIELTFGDFMELVLQLRGTNTCTVKDIVDLRKFVVTELKAISDMVVETMEELSEKGRHRNKSMASTSTSSLALQRFECKEYGPSLSRFTTCTDAGAQ